MARHSIYSLDGSFAKILGRDFLDVRQNLGWLVKYD